MRRPLGALVCLGSLAALSTPAVAAHAAAAPRDTCRLQVSTPTVTPAGKIEVTGTRAGCDDRALLRIRIKQAKRGPDRVLVSGARRGVDGTLTIRLRCGTTPRTYYAVAVDYRGNAAKSPAVRLSCSPTGTPSPSPSGTPAPTPTATPTATPSPPPAGEVGTAEENEVVRLTNLERQKGGCAPLKHDPQLRKAAYGHSADMAAQNYFSHTSKDGRSFMDRIRGAGFTGGSGFAENIAAGQRTPADVVKAWMNSSGHRANIMNCKYNLIGAGLAKKSDGTPYWTQNFAAK
ncbi:CAP domain-containing protein [Planomonospora sp. ID67723]|uniref:CAP domain-containing protein n=1 Tax=Planomonospora sp. ID67723 TaxID=2738134 RepID=UPI0018C3C46D|nr:CAP domain-containing protein [Planomonospora sp. ID67723]MBG0832290.1 CAP domain-containing protein [Planomonospora sp. ID67723]